MKAVRPADVLKQIPISRSTMYRMIESGDFPRPFKISKQCTAFNQSEIDDWLDKQFLESKCGNEKGDNPK